MSTSTNLWQCCYSKKIGGVFAAILLTATLWYTTDMKYYLHTNAVDGGETWELSTIKHLLPRGCKIPPDGFKAWKQGLVTTIHPEIQKNCFKLISGDKEETERVKNAKLNWKENYSYNDLLSKTENCLWLREYLNGNLYNTELEIKFPIAYSFIIYDSPRQFLRLLKILYKPQNTYCIHIDKKSAYQEFFTNIARCFPNIFLASKSFDVRWGHPSLLSSQMTCLSDLLHYREVQKDHRKWMYVINLCGKELPLISTKEMVKKLIYMNGTSSVVAWPAESWSMWRLQKNILPFNLSYYKSMTYNALSASFVQFLIKNSSAQLLFDFFISKTAMAEEHFYATLFRMPNVPGGYNPQIPKDDYFEVGHYFWRTNAQELSLPCFGKSVHSICVVNYADLPRIMGETKNGSNALFQNKYFMKYDHIGMDCMEERIIAMNKEEFQHDCLNTA